MFGARIGGGFINTNELHTIKYEDAMSSKERPSWIKAIEEEFDNMTDHGVFEPVEKSMIPAGAKILSTTWVMKKRPVGESRHASPSEDSSNAMEIALTHWTRRLQW
jgi:hypothetical protein